MDDSGYVNFYSVLDLKDDASPGDVRKTYRRKMKDLVNEIHNTTITEARRNHFLLEMAKLNAAVYILRDRDLREQYWTERAALIDLEQRWRDAAEKDHEASDKLRREFDGRVRGFLSRFVEEAMLEAGRDKECVEASGWNRAHEAYASPLTRKYRHMLYHDILERLPFHHVTKPVIEWDERRATVKRLLQEAVS